MKKVRLRVCALVFTIPVLFVLGAWQWPVDPQRVERSFGAPLGEDGIERGLVFDADGEEVQAVANGTVIFRDTGASNSAGLPRGGGIVILEHPNGLRSFYSGLSPEGPSAGERVLQGRTLGIGGQHGVRFELFDVRQGWYANPFTLLDLIPDVEPPEIAGIMLVSEDGESSEESQRTVLPVYNRASHPSGEAEVRLLLPEDAGEEIAAPYRVALTQGGETIHEIEFARVEVHDGKDRLVWDGMERTATSMHAEDGWIRMGKITVPEGSRVSFTARVIDHRGNERTRLFTVDGVSDED